MRQIKKQDGGEKLKFLIAVYDGGNMAYHNYDKENDCLGAPEQLTTGSTKHLFKFVKGQKMDHDYSFGSNIIPNEVLYFKSDEKYIIWYTKPCVKEILFKNELIKSGEFPIPYLLWSLKGKSLYVNALYRKPKSLEDTLYQAPFMNVSSSGSVCMGSANFSSSSINYMEIIEKIESAFFNSYFTHTNENSLLNGNFIELLEEMRNTKKFNNKLLIKKKDKIKSHVRNY